METARSFKLGFAAFAAGTAAALLLGSCTVNVEEKPALELSSSYPSDGQADVRVFGPYIFVFNKDLKLSAEDSVSSSFPATVTASHETLYVNPQEPFLAFGSSQSITVYSLTDGDGQQADLKKTVRFTLAAGENEDNDSAVLADTLRAGAAINGRAGKDGNAPVDDDYFLVAGADTDSVIITVHRLTANPVICVLPDTAYVLEFSATVSFTVVPPFLFFLTNRHVMDGVEENFGRYGWYSITAHLK
jgi:hypothetical protein